MRKSWPPQEQLPAFPAPSYVLGTVRVCLCYLRTSFTNSELDAIVMKIRISEFLDEETRPRKRTSLASLCPGAKCRTHDPNPGDLPPGSMA